MLPGNDIFYIFILRFVNPCSGLVDRYASPPPIIGKCGIIWCCNNQNLFLMQITHDALNAPLPILRAMYELQMKRTDSFFSEVQKRWASALLHLIAFV